jgi:hypothetical protein
MAGMRGAGLTGSINVGTLGAPKSGGNVSRREKIGLAVYKREDWPRLLDEADDAGELERTWEEWEQNLRTAEDQMDGLGIKYREIEVNLDELEEFCLRKRLPNTSGTRAEFAAERVWKKKKEWPD